MTDKTAFSDDEWHALTDAPLLVTAAVFAAGEHGPISMVKEASASARRTVRCSSKPAASCSPRKTAPSKSEAGETASDYSGRSSDGLKPFTSRAMSVPVGTEKPRMTRLWMTLLSIAI